jgi:anti-anti-sigma factor
VFGTVFAFLFLEHAERHTDKSTPIARWGRKARSLGRSEMVQLPNVDSREGALNGVRSDGSVPGRSAAIPCVSGNQMLNTFPSSVEVLVHPLVAPARLTSDQRLEFRRAVLEALEEAVRARQTAVEIDLSLATEIDASGLGVLVLLQKRAREKGLRTRLLYVPAPVSEMLHVTRLDTLFEISR